MISGFGGSTRSNDHVSSHHISGGALPVPFNIPNVLHNLLFEDIGIEFNAKQQDMIDTLQFSSDALARFNRKYIEREEKLRTEIFHNPDNIELQEEHEELQLDFLNANHYYKDLVDVLSEMLTKEQYAKLLKFSNIPV